jgi:alanine racemase
VTSGRDGTSRPPIEARLREAGLPPLDRLAWLEIDTRALEHNVRTIRSRVGAGTQVWPVVKDDAYGHGLEVATRCFAAGGAAGVCVATLGEAQAIRAAGIDIPVLILYPVPDAVLDEAVRAGFILSVSADGGAAAVADAWAAARIGERGARLEVHVEVETGFTRMGVQPERLDATLEVLRGAGIGVGAVWSHLSTPQDAGVSAEQEARLAEALRLAGEEGIGDHLAASGGLLTGRGLEGMLVRPGLVAYGVVPDGDPGGQVEEGARAAWAAELQPAMRLVARPMRVEEVPAGTRVGYGGTWVAADTARIATLPVGYGDGYSRAFTGGEVLVRGRSAPVVGVISMDATTLDVTSIAGVDTHDEVVLLGAQGGRSIGVVALAQRRTTIPWEVLTGMARRLTRVYDAPTGVTGVRTLAGETLVR